MADQNDNILLKTRNILEKQPQSSEAISAFLNLLEEKSNFEQAQNQRQNSSQDGWIPVLGRTAAGVSGFWGKTIGTDSKIIETHLEELVQKHINASVVNSITADVSVDSQAMPVIRALNNAQASLIQTTGSDDDQIVQFVDCPQIHKLFPDCFALQIDGDSMAPRIDDGDIVIISPSIPASHALPAIVRICGAIGVTCKLVRTEDESVHLVPINEKYDAKIINKKDLLWALAVLCHIKLKSLES